MLHCTKLERRVKDIGNIFVRHEVRKTISRVVLKVFRFLESMTHHSKFSTHIDIEAILKERASVKYLIDDDQDETAQKLKTKRVEGTDGKKSIIDQALAVLKNAEVKINRDEQKLV